MDDPASNRETHEDPLDRLLAECLDHPESQWSDRLAELCSTHPDHAVELRRRFVRLVQLGIVDAPVATEGSPERLGPYRLLRRLGAGTMGVVWLAEDERLGRQVALKILRREHLYFEGARQRFRREMEAAAKLDHPALCSIYEAGEQDGVPYLAMRHVAGRTLTEWLDEQRQARSRGSGTSGADAARRDQVCDWVATLAHALHVAHEAGFVHRDVKPANVVLDQERRPVLLDFGLAHALDEEHGARLTATGAQLGTPAYMAPEQVQGAPVDRRTDVWALGILLYECLTLRLPFEGGTRESLFREILASDPPRVNRIERSVPEDLALVVATALAKSPAERYATARALSEDLLRVRRHERIAARQPPAWLRARRWTQRHPVATAVVALLGLALAITSGFAVALERNLRRTQALVLAAEVRKTLEEDPTLSLPLARLALAKEPCLETHSAAFAALAESRCVWLEDLADPPQQAMWTAGEPPGVLVRTNAEVKWRRGRDGPWQRLLGSECDRVTVIAAGQLILAKVKPGRLRAWHCSAGTPSEASPLELTGVEQICTHPALPYVLSFSQKDAVLVDVLTRRQHSLPLDYGRTREVAFSPDGSQLAVVEGDRSRDALAQADAGPPTLVKTFGLDGRVIGDPKLHPTAVDAIAYAADGRLLTGAADGRLRMFAGTEPEFTFPETHEARVWTIVPAASAPRAITRDIEGFLYYWDLDQRRLLWRRRTTPLLAIAISADGAHVAAPLGNLVQVLDRHGEVVARLHHAADIGALHFSPDGRLVLTSSTDRTVRISDLSWSRMPILATESSAVREVDWSPDGGTIATVGLDGVLRLWPATGGRPRREIGVSPSALEGTFHGPIGGFSSVRYMRDGETIVVGSRGYVWLFDREGVERKRLPLPDGFQDIPRFEIAPDQEHVVICSGRMPKGGGKVWLLRLNGGTAWGVPFDPREDGAPYCAAFVDEGNLIAIGDDRGRVRVLYRATGQTRTEPWPAHTAHRVVGAIAAIARTDRFVSTGFDGVVRIWDVHGQPHGELLGHTNAVKGCAVHGDLLATASFDRTVRLWNLRTLERVAILEGHDDLVFDVRFSPDGSQVVSGSWDRSARVWPTDCRVLPGLLEERKVREYRPEERRRFERN